jgi:transcriptional regulator with XRE-family HTH domain
MRGVSCLFYAPTMKPHPQSPPKPTLSSQPSAKNIADRLRTLRRERGWSLADVERISKGSMKAGVLGSYERCDRTLNLNRAIELANIFSIPLVHLLAAPEKHAPIPTRATIVIDLRRIRTLAQNSSIADGQVLRTISSLLAWIGTRRGDWNGEVMSLRESDRATMALMTYMGEEDLLNWLAQNKLLVTELNRP